MASPRRSRVGSILSAALLLAVLFAPAAQAVTTTSATLLVRWNGAGCLGTTTGTSLTAFADATTNAYDKTESWPGVGSSTRCTGQTLSITFTGLAKWDSGANIQYVFSARITDTSGTASFLTPSSLKLTCSGTSTNYVHAGGVTCNDPGPGSYLQVGNNAPPTPTITNLYQDFPSPETSLYLAWGGVTPMPSDFDGWEVHMSRVQGFTPSYSFPTTLLSRHTWGSHSRSVGNLEPGTQYCFRVRLADRYWEPDNVLTRPHPSFGESAERCASTRGLDLTVAEPNGGEVWSHNHTIAWTGGSPAFTAEVSADGGGTWSTLATGVTPRSLLWNTANHPDGTDYVVRVRDGASSDVSDAAFWVDNTPPVTTVEAIEGAQCNGWYTEPPVATLAATDNLAGVRRTEWRVDGGAWTAYAGPFQVPGEGHLGLQFRSDDRADIPNVEAQRHEDLRVDLNPPVTTIAVGVPQFQGDRRYVNSSTPFTLAATDAGSGVNVTEYRVAGGAWQPYGGPFGLAGPDGPYTIGYRSTDFACHTEAERSLEVFLDNTHPVVDIVEPAAGSVTLDGQRLVAPSDLLGLLDLLLAQLPPEVQAQVGELQQRARGLGEDPPLGPGDLCELARILGRELRARDLGAVADLLEGLLCAAPLPGDEVAVVSGTVTVQAEAADPVVNGGASSMDRVEFFVDGALRATDADAPYAWDWNTTAEEPGRHTLRVVAYDHLDQGTAAEREVLVLPSAVPGPEDLFDALPPLLEELLAFVRDRLPALPPLPAPPALPPVPPRPA